MTQRDYYSIRTGKQSDEIQFDFEELKQLVLSNHNRFEGEGYFAEALGQYCVDNGATVGKMGTKIDLFFVQRLKKRNMWPIDDYIEEYTIDDLFSMLELLYDYVSKPKNSSYHGWDNCGYHYSNFDAETGKEEFRAEINGVIKQFSPNKYELSYEGEILEIPDNGLETLIEQTLPATVPDTVETKMAAAIRKFRRFGSSVDDRRDAVRDLADILELIRPDLKKVISSKDDGDLFNIANNFSIRHNNPGQKTNYDQELWLKWMFYTYLATIHVVLGTLAKAK